MIDYSLYGIFGLALITATTFKRSGYWRDHRAIILRSWKTGVSVDFPYNA